MSSPHLAPRRPRILQCVSHLALGGAERVAVTLMQSLRADYDFGVYAVRGLADGEVGHALKNQLAALRIPVESGPRIPMRFGGVITGAIGFARIIRRWKPDLVHLHTEIPEASYAAMLAVLPRFQSIPVIRTIHNSVIWSSWPWLGRACDRQLAHAGVACVSKDALKAFNALRTASGAASPSIPPAIIFNGVRSVTSPHPTPPSAGVIRMVYGGRFEPEKGTDLLPDIVRRTQLPPGCRAHLTIHGSGRHEPKLRSLGRHAPSGWTVEILPPVSDFSSRLSAFDLALLPSRHEGLSLVAIEALLAGIQVVATDAPGLREAIPPNHPWLARVGDAASFAATLQYACANRDRWPVIADAGKEFARERFSAETMAEKYRSLYERARSSVR